MVTMRYVASAALLIASTTFALAGPLAAVPEIEVGAGLAAIAVVGAVGAYLWERRDPS